MSLVKKAVFGTSWTAGSMVVQVVVQLLRLSILTRFLSKTDFGLVAIVTLVLGFTHIFTDLGISTVLFSRNDITKKEYSSLYWVSFLSGVFLYLLLLLFTPLIAGFYDLNELRSLIPVMGLDLIIATAGRQFKVFKQKELRFKEIAIIEIIAALVSLGLAVYLAANNYGVYSLVYSTILNSLLSSTLLILTSIQSHPISFYLNIKENKSLYKVGLYQTGAQILDFVSSQLDIIIIGKIMGPADLGVYNLIKQLVLRPYSLLNPIIQNVGIPILVKLRNDAREFNALFLRLLKAVGFISFPVYALIALFAQEVLLILYGKSYVTAALPLQVLCIWGGVMSLLGSASILVIVTGKTNLGFNWTIFRVITNPVFVMIGGIWGVLGISVGQAICIVSFLFLYWFFFIKRVVNISLKSYSSSFLSLLAITCLAFIAGIFIKMMAGNWMNEYVADTIVLFVFGLIYLGLNKSFLQESYSLFAARSGNTK
ncbi:MOP flippase family protein [Chitinophaga sp. G-6-1-13]|uniref:MOP flippase family protein n=1 Tax=Chitinophaga fulva TaxID=2728842 RepID=A0A848GDI8_9BACT|nr:MOP flippase family protein [Chitinophaga fulva]NML35837.1 MOP flippase family protein [Chitinophaga fulva]